METIFTGIRNEMDLRHVSGSEFAATEVLDKFHQLKNNTNETLNNWKNRVDDGDLNNIINGGEAVDENNYNYF